MSTDNTNGNGATPRPNGVQKIALSFTPETFALHVDFDVINLDVATAMLQQALRLIDKQLRLAAMLEAQRAIADAARDAKIAAELRNGAHRG